MTPCRLCLRPVPLSSRSAPASAQLPSVWVSLSRRTSDAAMAAAAEAAAAEAGAVTEAATREA